MFAYFVRRVLISVPLLFAVLLATFILLHALPGDPTHALLGTKWTAEAAERIREQEGLDDPIHVQFGDYLLDIATRGDLGRNQKKKPVAEELRSRLPATIELAVAALLVAVVGGVPLGLVGAAYPRTCRDGCALTVSLVGVSVPIFWMGLLAQRFFRRGGMLCEATGFAGMPLGGRLSEEVAARVDQQVLQAQFELGEPLRRTGFHLVDALFVFRDGQMFLDALVHLTLPAAVLATVPLAMITRITRSAVGEQLGHDYIRTARAKGVTGAMTLWRHALRNAAIPIITSIGSQLGYLLGGAVLTETIFNWPGLGTYIVDAILKEDVRPLQAGVLVIATGFILINLLVDLSYALLDPRVRLGGDGR